MTRAEALKVVHWIRWHFNDRGCLLLESLAEDCESRLASGFSPEDFKAWAAILLLPPGKRGRVRLVLHHPYQARALALLNAVVCSVPD